MIAGAAANESAVKPNGLRFGNWFKTSRLYYKIVVYFTYFWLTDQTAIEFCSRELRMNPSTTLDWNDYLRDLCARAVYFNKH